MRGTKEPYQFPLSLLTDDAPFPLVQRPHPTHTRRRVGTTHGTADTGSAPMSYHMLGRPRRYQKCSTRVRTDTTSGRAGAVAKHNADNGCATVHCR